MWRAETAHKPLRAGSRSFLALTTTGLFAAVCRGGGSGSQVLAGRGTTWTCALRRSPASCCASGQGVRFAVDRETALGRHQRADLLPGNNIADIARVVQIKDDHRQIIVFAETHRRSVHHL